MTRLSRPLTPSESNKLFDPIMEDEPRDLFTDYTLVPNDEPIIHPHELIAPTIPEYLKQDEEELDFLPLAFGKHRGLTPEQVSIKDPGWIVWAKTNVTNRQICSDALYRDCLANTNSRR